MILLLTYMSQDGRRVRVIEKDFNEIDRIAGEGLLPAGYRKLLELGLEGKQEIGINLAIFDSFLRLFPSL